MATDTRNDEIPWESQTPDGQVLLSMPWEIFVFGAAVLSIVNLVLAIVLHNADLIQVFAFIEALLILIFAVDLMRRLRVADDNRAYLVHGYGWLDVISIIPALTVARILRIARVVRIVNRMGGLGPALRMFFADKAAGGLLVVFFIAILVLEFGSLLMIAAERGAPDANILSAEDAVWYVIVTMSTVGYGDFFPVSGVGRLVGVGIIVVGVGVFGTLTGFLANAFLSPSKE